MCFFPRRESSTLMWLKSLRKVPLGPFTMTVRPFSETLTANQRQAHVNRLRSRHHEAPFTRRRTLLGDVNGLVAEDGLHPARDSTETLQSPAAGPLSRTHPGTRNYGHRPAAPTLLCPATTPGTAQRRYLPPRPRRSGEKRRPQRSTPQRGPARA